MVRLGWQAVVFVVIAGAASACARPGIDLPAASPPAPSSPVNSAGALPVPTPRNDSVQMADGARLPSVGQCIDASRQTVGCTTPHQAEVTLVGDLPEGLPTTLPDDSTLMRAGLPTCRAALGDYVGSKDADATSLQTWAFWPQQEEWFKGARWLVCAATQIDSIGTPTTIRESIRNGLAGAGFAKYQTCTVSSPSKSQDLSFGACDGPHLGEAMPGVQSLGRSTDPMPPTEQINSIAKQRCSSELASYLGTGNRDDVTFTWRAPNTRQAWSQGYTNLICYAESDRDVKSRLRGIGSGPLPA
jgi:Septum formation